MERTRRGGFKKSSDYVEVLVNSADSYAVVLMKACDVLNLPSESAVLVRISGHKIPNQPLVVGGSTYPWTIGRYAEHAFARSTSLKLGILCSEVNESVFIHHCDNKFIGMLPPCILVSFLL